MTRWRQEMWTGSTRTGTHAVLATLEAYACCELMSRRVRRVQVQHEEVPSDCETSCPHIQRGRPGCDAGDILRVAQARCQSSEV